MLQDGVEYDMVEPLKRLRGPVSYVRLNHLRTYDRLELEAIVGGKLKIIGFKQSLKPSQFAALDLSFNNSTMMRPRSWRVRPRWMD
jgi:hypothetical protein